MVASKDKNGLTLRLLKLINIIANLEAPTYPRYYLNFDNENTFQS
jgi:hypothetical protein